jgi:hypothetical protein
MPYKSAQRQNKMLGGISLTTGVLLIVSLLFISWIGLGVWEVWVEKMESISGKSLECLK